MAAAARLDARLYQDAFAADGLVSIAPEGELRSRFMALLYRMKAGEVGLKSRSERGVIAGSLAADSLAAGGAELIVSGCTEVPLGLGPDDLAAPLVDSTGVRVAAALAFARLG